jgi:nuclear GTP-binding protein
MQGGEADISTVAKMLLNDFQRGKIPYYTMPPGCEPPMKDGIIDDDCPVSVAVVSDYNYYTLL